MVTRSAAAPGEARAIATEAYIYAYAPLYNYKTLFQQTQDASFPGYIGGFGRFRHYARGFTPDDTDIVTPSNDTPYSWAWLDLRAEPVVLGVPALPSRYYVLQWFDMYTHNFAYVGSRATGVEAGQYLLVGPNWNGEVPKGIAKLIRSETEVIGTLTRTAWTGPEEKDALQSAQRQYRCMPSSEFAGTRPPAPAPVLSFPAWDEARAASPSFISYLNFILQFCPEVPAEKDMLMRFARIGIGAGRPFDAAAIDPILLASISQGIADAKTQLDERIAEQRTSTDIFGTREFLGEDFAMKRAVAAAMGIYGNSKEEAVYVGGVLDAAGETLDGKNRYVLHFDKEQVPPVQFFWSQTMYNMPQRLLVANPINRYAIGSHTPGLKTEADGSINLYIQADSPGADKESNWLPSPATGAFYMILRMYGAQGSLIDGSWKRPEPTRVK